MNKPTIEDVTRHLLQLRQNLAHSLTQPHISAQRFNEIREQLIPLDEQLRKMGVTNLEVVPQMSPSYVIPSRYDRRKHKRADKFNSYEAHVRRRFENDAS